MVPTVQLSHLVKSACCLVPFGQASHFSAAVELEKKPAEQIVHVDAPVYGENWPGKQSRQIDWPTNEKRPMPHSRHAVKLVTPAYRPTLQSKQVVQLS